MTLVVARPYGKRFVLAPLLVSALAAYFWTQSRLPLGVLRRGVSDAARLWWDERAAGSGASLPHP
jgi:hypothetical protein